MPSSSRLLRSRGIGTTSWRYDAQVTARGQSSSSEQRGRRELHIHRRGWVVMNIETIVRAATSEYGVRVCW